MFCRNQPSGHDTNRVVLSVSLASDKDVIDEMRGVEKNIDQVTANQAGLTGILHTRKQAVCERGGIFIGNEALALILIA